jgi:hypothetical protein
VLSADDRERCIKRCYIPVLSSFFRSKTTTVTHFAYFNSPLFLTHQPHTRPNAPLPPHLLPRLPPLHTAFPDQNPLPDYQRGSPAATKSLEEMVCP